MSTQDPNASQPTGEQPSGAEPTAQPQVAAEHYAAAPTTSPRKSWFGRHKVLTGFGIAIVAIIVIAALGSALGGGSSDDEADSTAEVSSTEEATEAESEAEAPAEDEPAGDAKVGDVVTVGDFEITIVSIEDRGTEVGNEYLTSQAQGKFVGVNIKVTNVGNEAETFFSDNVKLVDDQERSFDYSSEATLYDSDDNDVWLSEINPGNTLEGQIIFDLNADATATAVLVSDSLFGGNETRITI